MKTAGNDNDSMGLTAPTCPQADQRGVIDLSIVSGPIIVRVPPYSNMIEGDIIVAFFNSVPTAPEVVPPGTPPGQSIDLYLHRDTLYSGDYHVWYHATDRAGNMSAPSASLLVKIINGLSGVLPPPVFPQADSQGVISYQDVDADGGVFIHSAYTPVSEGNLVVFYWQGYDVTGKLVPLSSYTSSVIASDADSKAGYVATKIPADNVLILGEQGKGSSYYVLYPEGVQSGDFYPSLTANVTFSNNSVGGAMKCYMTTGAALRSDKYPGLNPENSVVVFGTPGIKIQISVSPGATINALNSAGTSGWDRLDEYGQCTFTVYENVSDNPGGVVQVTLYQDDNPSNNTTGEMSFLPYRIGRNGISRYSYTTGAIGDGNTKNSIYLITDSDVSLLYAIVSGSAKINSLDNKLTITVNNGVATTSVIDSYAETVTVKIGKSSDMSDAIEFQMNFVNKT